jgi:hypothetical protein
MTLPVRLKASVWTGAYPDEVPILEGDIEVAARSPIDTWGGFYAELGINLVHIKLKTVSVLHPTKEIDSHIMDDTDLV